MKLPEEIVKRAMLEVAAALPDYPEDDWKELSEDWDLNLYTQFYQGTTIYGASVYRCIRGGTCTDDYVRIVEFIPEGANP